jgi:hypothetical protein
MEDPLLSPVFLPADLSSTWRTFSSVLARDNAVQTTARVLARFSTRGFESSRLNLGTTLSGHQKIQSPQVLVTDSGSMRTRRLS